MKNYVVIPTLRDDGTFVVTVSNFENNFSETVIIAGRETRLVSDLEYTKTALSMTGMQPFLKSLSEEIKQGEKDAKPAK